MRAEAGATRETSVGQGVIPGHGTSRKTKKIQAFHRLVLQTERLLLRPLAASDAGALFAIFSDRQVTRYWSSAAWDSQTTAEDYIAKDIKALRREHLRGD